MFTCWAALPRVAGSVNRVPWPDSPALFLSLLRQEGINVLENASSRFHSLVGSSSGRLDIR
jgi:hypothetical protein